ncbi:MAG: M48 family metallopeptidase [Candidatus Cloacimonetes bacterium]|nr:M48 family metallopeptidase [Candidatus Cloacimonadota bacterium]
MRKEFTKQMSGVGNIIFVRDSRNKKIKLSIKPFQGIRVSFPFHIKLTQVENFILQHKSAIISALEKMRDYEKQQQEQQDLNVKKINLKITTNFLTNRLEELALIHNFNFNRVTFRNQKTRWGSCSTKNNISLNLQIYLLPKHLQDYILLHELLHTKVKNHSQTYRDAFEQILPNAKKHNAEIMKYHLQKCEFV